MCIRDSAFVRISAVCHLRRRRRRSLVDSIGTSCVDDTISEFTYTPSIGRCGDWEVLGGQGDRLCRCASSPSSPGRPSVPSASIAQCDHGSLDACGRRYRSPRSSVVTSALSRISCVMTISPEVQHYQKSTTEVSTYRSKTPPARSSTRTPISRLYVVSG